MSDNMNQTDQKEVVSRILTDFEMTKLVSTHTKGGIRAQRNRRIEWCDFTEQAFEQEQGEREKFVRVVNTWLKKHKVPVTVVGFDFIEGSVMWTIGG